MHCACVYTLRRDREGEDCMRAAQTFGEGDDDQGSVHKHGVGQMLGDSDGLRLVELYKTYTWSHRQGRITERKYRCFCEMYTQRLTTPPTVPSIKTGSGGLDLPGGGASGQIRRRPTFAADMKTPGVFRWVNNNKSTEQTLASGEAYNSAWWWKI